MNVNLGVQLHEYGLYIFKNLISGFSTINLKMRHGQLLFITPAFITINICGSKSFSLHRELCVIVLLVNFCLSSLWSQLSVLLHI
jgi:hypothetical protein